MAKTYTWGTVSPDTQISLQVGQSVTISVTLKSAYSGRYAPKWSTQVGADSSYWDHKPEVGQTSFVVTAYSVGSKFYICRLIDTQTDDQTGEYDLAQFSINVVVTDKTMADILVEQIILSPKDFHIKKGNTVEVTATIIPSNATNKEVKWSLPQGGFVTVKQNGNVAVVKGVRVGTTKLMCSSADGNAIASSGIWVEENSSIYAEEVVVSPNISTIELGKSVQFSAHVLPENAVNKQIEWGADSRTYLNSAHVSVDSNGLATGIAVGKGYVDAYTSMPSTRVSTRTEIEVVNPEGAILVRQIEISPSKLNLKVGDKVKLTASVYPANANYKGLFWCVPQGAITTVDQDGNVVAISAGSSRIIAKSCDGNAIGYITVNVTKADSSDEGGSSSPEPTSKYAVHLNPHNITVRKGQRFMIRVRAMDVEAISKSRVYKDNFLWIQYLGGGWKWSSSSDAIEFIRTEFINTHEAAAWFKAGNTPGNYSVTVYNDYYDGIPEVVCNITVINEYHGGNFDIILPSKYNVEFYGNDNPSSNDYSKNPCKLEWYTKEWDDMAGTSISNPEDYIGWRIPENNVISNISSDDKYLYVSRGPEYGIVGAQFYYKSEPYIYYPVWIEFNGGNYKYYLTDGSESETEQRVSIKLSKTNKILTEGDAFQLNVTVSGSSSNVLWNSSNNAVASVQDDGLVNALSEGTATITAYLEDDNDKKATCKIVVYSNDDTPDYDDQDDEESDNGDGIDTIVRIDYKEDGTFEYTKLYEGNLGFSLDNPIESVVYHETDDIQKIYWVDGKNVLRFMNFMADSSERAKWDDTYFDSNRRVSFGVNVEISKDNSGNTRPNGVIQYLLTYYNKHGQETGYVWISDLVYLSPVNSGGSADGTNMNSVTLSITNLDRRFSNFRIYSIFRSALNGTTVSYIVYDGTTSDGSAIVVDNNSHLIAEDSSRLLYLGSQPVRAGTLTHKDQTLFLGDLQSIGKNDYSKLERDIKIYMIDDDGMSTCINFEYSSGDDDIPYYDSDTYAYESQLNETSSKITTFKGGEKYRFALSFKREDGTQTEAFWIGDAINDKYPVIDGDKIHRALAVCTLPGRIVSDMKSAGFKTATLMIAEASYADRSIKAQGILNPTMFNVWDRYNGYLYSMSSWMMRPRRSKFAWKHFTPVKNSILSTGEIQCNYWSTDNAPNPYYRIKDYGADIQSYDEIFDSGLDYDYFVVVYEIKRSNPLRTGFANSYSGRCTVVTVKMLSFSDEAVNALNNFTFDLNFFQQAYDELMQKTAEAILNGQYGLMISADFIHPSEYFRGKIYTPVGMYSKNISGNPSKDFIYNCMVNSLLELQIPSQFIIPSGPLFYRWCDIASEDTDSHFFNYNMGESSTKNIITALNWKRGDSDRWYALTDMDMSTVPGYMPSYYKKHLMFVDENTITLNSPELDYEALLLDGAENYKLRIVGVAKIKSNMVDYVVDATPGKLAGENLVNQKFTFVSGLQSWPLWREYGIAERTINNEDEEYKHDNPNNPVQWTSKDYIADGSIRRYWLHMWQHPGSITTFNEYDYEGDVLVKKEDNYSILNSKTFANMRYSKETQYNNYGVNECSYDLESLRLFNFTSSQYIGVNVGDELRYYNGVIEESLSMPAKQRYPILYSSGSSISADSVEVIGANEDDKNTMFSDIPVQITYSSTPHIVMTLPTDTTNGYVQTILPRFGTGTSNPENVNIPTASENKTGSILPWLKVGSGEYPFADYGVSQDSFSLSQNPITGANRGVEGWSYLYIGEIYYDFGDNDTRYGGTTESAIQNNRFIIAGPQYRVDRMNADDEDRIVANQGDTFFQRWDCLKTKPYSTGAVNNVIDITSVMVETHVNIDGRTDLNRSTSRIASIDTEKFGTLNPVYTQQNNFFIQHDLDEDFNLDAYRSSVTWSLEKHDSAEIDEWTHVPLANTLKLDGDKGVCRALRRLNNNIISFQDRGISEILFNSRTQLSTQDGVPVEIANSGKVDGKRYITNKYGCTNKWSIVEGKNALYFVDNINKAFCAFNGQAIDSLSARLGFGAWFREVNNLDPWKPSEFNNIVSYYDKIHSDIYLVRDTKDDKPCLVYNETLGAFTSFFDYGGVTMMANVEDRFVSHKEHKMWLQNEGLYCNFFGFPYDYWVQYRVTPDPYLDKIWTNIDYRADFYEVLNSDGVSSVPEEYLINGDAYGDLSDTYKEWETFTDYKVWNEYQTTGFTDFTHDYFDRDDVRKKFRIWRLAIPRALREGTNRHGMDRIRNPWINLLFRKSDVDGRYLMQLHDIVVKYFE